MKQKKIAFLLLLFINFGCKTLCTNTTAQLYLPVQTCTTAGALTNLAQYVTDAPATGTFSGTGVVLQGSDYVFDATLAGVGAHTLTYAFQNTAGCPVTTITAVINVVDNCPQKPYISQAYYNGANRFVEVKNSSDTQSINAGNYYLAMYKDGELTNVAPTRFVNLGTITAQGVKVWKAQAGGDLGYVTATDWLDLNDYDGDRDQLILTTSSDANAYANRIDAFGGAPENTFYDNITLSQQASFVRMSCAPSIPTPTFNKEHWVYFTNTEVANANSKTNAVLGRHYGENLKWQPTNTWNEVNVLDVLPVIDESYPDRSRYIEILSDYCTGTSTTSPTTCPGPGYGSFEACGLSLDTGVTLTINPITYVKVFTGINATAAGCKLIVEDKGALVMVYDCYDGNCGVDLIDLGSNAIMQADRHTVGINSTYDYVYWSSPLSAAATNPTINQVFNFGTAPGVFNPNRFYIFENANFYDQLATYGDNGGGTDGYDDDLNVYNPLNTVAEQTAPFIPGRGYATWPPIGDNDGYNISFTGQMNNGEVTVPVYRNNSVNGDSLNLVGNPYPSAIDLKLLFAENEQLIEPLALIWGRLNDTLNSTNIGPNPFNYTEDNFLVYNPTMIIDPVFTGNRRFNDNGILASCQSFFVRTKDPADGYPVVNSGLIESAGNLYFKNKMRTTAPNTNFAKTETGKTMINAGALNQGDKLWLNLTDSEGYTAQLGVAFLPKASPNYAQGEDVKAINGRKYNFYTQSTPEDLIIDVQDAFTDAKIIPLGITNTSDNAQIMFTVSLAKVSGVFTAQTVYLYDAALNVYHNLSNGGYTFTTNAAVTEGRFSLVFSTNTVTFTKQTNDEKVTVFANENNVTVTSLHKKIVSVEVFDIYTANSSGILIGKKDKIHAHQAEIDVQKVIFMNVKIVLEDGTVLNKKIRK